MSEKEEPAHPMTMSDIGKIGGNRVKELYGDEHYTRIGTEGGQKLARERGTEYYREIGRKGGQSKSRNRQAAEEQNDGG